MQVAPVPPQAPLQPINTEPPVAVAVRVTIELAAKGLAQVPELLTQLIPAGLLVITPAPLPILDTVKVCSGTKVAVTVLAAVMATVQGSVPVQAPVQPVKTKVPFASAVSVTCVP